MVNSLEKFNASLDPGEKEANFSQKRLSNNARATTRQTWLHKKRMKSKFSTKPMVPDNGRVPCGAWINHCRHLIDAAMISEKKHFSRKIISKGWITIFATNITCARLHWEHPCVVRRHARKRVKFQSNSKVGHC